MIERTTSNFVTIPKQLAVATLEVIKVQIIGFVKIRFDKIIKIDGPSDGDAWVECVITAVRCANDGKIRNTHVIVNSAIDTVLGVRFHEDPNKPIGEPNSDEIICYDIISNMSEFKEMLTTQMAKLGETPL